MPELPEVEALVQDLRGRLVGRAISRIDLTAFNFGITGAQILAQAINVDLAGTANDHVFFYLTSAGGVDNFIVFMGMQSSQLSAGDFITGTG